MRPAVGRCRSGRTGRIRNPLCTQVHLGFESLSSRHIEKIFINQVFIKMTKRQFVAVVCSNFCSKPKPANCRFFFAFPERSAPDISSTIPSTLKRHQRASRGVYVRFWIGSAKGVGTCYPWLWGARLGRQRKAGGQRLASVAWTTDSLRGKSSVGLVSG